MPNMEKLLNHVSVEITRDRTAQLFLSKIDLDYAYVQMKLSDETSRQCVFALTGRIFFINRTNWLGHEIDENGIKPNEEKVGDILKLKAPENTKDLKSFFGAIQYMAKVLPKQTD